MSSENVALSYIIHENSIDICGFQTVCLSGFCVCVFFFSVHRLFNKLNFTQAEFVVKSQQSRRSLLYLLPINLNVYQVWLLFLVAAVAPLLLFRQSKKESMIESKTFLSCFFFFQFLFDAQRSKKKGTKIKKFFVWFRRRKQKTNGERSKYVLQDGVNERERERARARERLHTLVRFNGANIFSCSERVSE